MDMEFKQDKRMKAGTDYVDNPSMMRSELSNLLGGNEDQQVSRHMMAASALNDQQNERKRKDSSSDEGSDDDDDGDSEDSGAGPSRWNQPNSLEMDCVFLEEENEDSTNLPTFLDSENIPILDSKACMLCSETFGKLKMVYKHNCKRCGKAVCENCSKQKRRLS